MKKSNKPIRPKRPKGSYPLPNGNYVTKGRVDCSGRRAIWIEAIHKDPPDMEKLAKALLYLAEADARAALYPSGEHPIVDRAKHE